MQYDRIPVDRSNAAAFGSGAIIGTLGGLIGLGGAEFRLPLLISQFRFHGLEAVILNKAVSLVVVATALPFRTRTVPLEEIGAHWPLILNILCGSLIGAWAGAEWATRLKSGTLYRVIAVLLVVIAGVLLLPHDAAASTLVGTGWIFVATCIGVGFVVGVIASLLGVAGGEFLIPALILLCGVDIKLAGSLSLAISLPTMLVGFTRYSRDQSFSVLPELGILPCDGGRVDRRDVHRRTAARPRTERRAVAAACRAAAAFSGEGLAASIAS